MSGCCTPALLPATAPPALAPALSLQPAGLGCHGTCRDPPWDSSRPVDRGEPAETVRSTPYPRSPPAPAAKCSTLQVLNPTATMDTNSLSQSLDSVNTAISVVGEEEVSVLSWSTAAASASARGQELPDRTI